MKGLVCHVTKHPPKHQWLRAEKNPHNALE